MRQQSQRHSSIPRAQASEHMGTPNASILPRIGLGILCMFASFGQVVLAADGNPDTSFAGDGMRQIVFPDSYTDEDSVQVGSDAHGSVFVATKYRNADITGFTVLKIKPNGKNDTSFGFGGYASIAFSSDFEELYGIFPQPDGSVMLFGAAEINSDYYPVMAKFTSTGDNDSSFGVGGILVITQTPWVNPNLYVEAATRQDDGKFLFVGSCDCPGNDSTFLLRTSANGVPDPTFGTNGWASVASAPNAYSRAVSVDSAGRVVLAGQSNIQALVLRVSPNGALDTSFGTAGIGYALINLLPNSHATAIEFDSNDEIVVALVGSGNGTQSRQTGLVRLLPNGERDLNYAGGFRDLSLEFGSEIGSLQRRSDGRIVAAGWIDHTGAAGSSGSDILIARVLPNGALDNSFDGNGLRRIALSSNRDTAEAMVLSAGKPVIAGISQVVGVTQLGVLRMQSDLIFSDGFQ